MGNLIQRGLSWFCAHGKHNWCANMGCGCSCH